MTNRLKSCLILTVVLLVSTASAQELSLGEQRMLDIYGTKIEQMKSKGGDKYDFMVFSAQYGYEIVDAKTVRKENVLQLNDVPLQTFYKGEFAMNPETLNPLVFNFSHNPSIRNYYSIGNSGKVLVCFSFEEIDSMFKAFKN